MESESEYTFAFFPFLKTSAPVHYRGLTVRSTDDLTDLPSDAVQHLETIRAMFFLRDNLRIQKMLYACHVCEEDKADTVSFIQRLLELQALICFVYSTPGPTSGEPFLRYEHSSLYLLKSKRISKYLLELENDHNLDRLPRTDPLEIDDRGDVQGYEGRLNNRSYFWVAKGSRIYPPAVGLWLNISQDLRADFGYIPSLRRHQPVVEYFATREQTKAIDERVLTAISWYNRSIQIDTDDEVALVDLAIAFESLLDLRPGEKVTDRFKEAVTLLVGGVPRLESWLTQFYDARSEIIHRGQSRNLMFIATDDPKTAHRASELAYRPLVSYGRHIFRICIATVLTGASLAEQLGLPSMLVTNQQRLERICEKLSKGEGTSAERILAVRQDVQDIETYRFVPEEGLKIDQLIGTAKLTVHKYLETGPNETSELVERMTELAKVDSRDHYEALMLLKEVQEGFEALQATYQLTQPDVHSIVVSLIDSVWHYTWMHYYWLERAQDRKEPDEAV
jgi:hypothetical protein